MTSSVAAGEPTKALRISEASALGISIFSGQQVDDTTVLVKFTYGGDANLDSQVDIADLGRLATAWQSSGAWINGDSDYSGFVDIADLGMLATNWQSGANPMGASGLGEALLNLGLPGASIPEPAMGSMLAIALLRGRKHKFIWR